MGNGEIQGDGVHEVFSTRCIVSAQQALTVVDVTPSMPTSPYVVGTVIGPISQRKQSRQCSRGSRLVEKKACTPGTEGTRLRSEDRHSSRHLSCW